MCAAVVPSRHRRSVLREWRHAAVVRIEALNHFYGRGESRSQVLFDTGSSSAPDSSWS